MFQKKTWTIFIVVILVITFLYVLNVTRLTKRGHNNNNQNNLGQQQQQQRSNDWLEIWSTKAQKAAQTEDIHKVNGFDVMTGEEYDSMVSILTKAHFDDVLLQLPKRESSSPTTTMTPLVFEFGSGSGGFLSSFKKLYPNIHIAGLDYSHSLVQRAQQHFAELHMKEHKTSANSPIFFVADATNVPFIMDESFDHTVSFSILHYLNSEEDVRKMFREMIRVTKKGGKIFIGDVNDCDKKQLALELRKKTHTVQQRVSSKDLTQLFTCKSLFEEEAQRHGLLNLKIVDEDKILPFYDNSVYRYSVYATKP